MFADTDCWLSQCKQCHIAKGDYTEPKTQQGTLTASQPLELLCIDFTKADPSKGGKENILVLTDAFSKFSQAFVTSSQKALIVAKLLVEKWFSFFGIPAQIHSDQGWSFDNEIISHLCKMYGIRQSTTMPYNLHGNAICKRFNRTLFGLMRTLTERAEAKLACLCAIFGLCLQFYSPCINRVSAIRTYVWAQSSNALQWLAGPGTLQVR